jgi:hypothetical protein
MPLDACNAKAIGDGSAESEMGGGVGGDVIEKGGFVAVAREKYA